MQAVICLAHSKSQFETLLADHALGTTLQTRLQQQQYRIIQPTSVELVVGWPAIQCYSFFVYFLFYFNIFYLFSLQCCIKLHTNVFTYFTVLLPQLLHVSLSSILHPQRHNRPENLSEKKRNIRAITTFRVIESHRSYRSLLFKFWTLCIFEPL